jgi:tetratricopeptide (TPR) repeat protein
MKPMTAGIILSTVALLVQGTRCLIRQGAPPFVRRFGALTLLLAGLSAVLFVLLHFGEAVLSPEFDSVMARGHRRGLAALVLGLALAASLGLHVQRLKSARPGRLAALLFLGVVVGVLATMRITTLNDDETEAFRIYAYDLWWPPLLLWVSGCLLDGAITILGVTDRRVRVGAFAVLLVGLSWAARSRSFGDPMSERLWTWVFGAGVVLFLAFGVLLVRAAPGGARGAWPWLVSLPRRARLAAAHAWQEIVVEGWEDELTMVRERVAQEYGRLLALLALVTIGATLIDIFYIGRFSHVAALIVLAVAWTCLAEVTAEGPLRAFVVNTLPSAYEALASQQSRLGSIWSTLRAWLAVPLQTIRGAAARLLSLRPLPEGLLKLAILLVAAVVLFEIPNRGKTLLQPFKASVVKPKQGEVPSVEQQAAIGQVVFDHLVNTLGALTQDLQPDVILLLPPDPLRGVQFRTIAAGGSGSIDPFLSGTSDVDLGVGVKIPLGFVLTPIVKPVRWMLGVRTIEGSVLADPQGYTVLVRASSGEVWQARLRPTQESLDRLAPASAFKDLALELAFRIMSAEPNLASMGMTRSWDAFDRFREGLEHWQRYAIQSGEQDPDALTQAIRSFRAAVGVDPAFGLAHYRLGLALQKDGQPIAAAEALRTSLNKNPGFLPARVALASVLYSRESRTLARSLGPAERWRRGMRPARDARSTGAPSTTLAGAGPAAEPERSGEQQNAMLDEARALWQSVVQADEKASPLDQAAAWAGLCQYAFERGSRGAVGNRGEKETRWIWPTGAGPRLLHAAYFHCQQADRFYAALLDPRWDDVRVRTARASVLATIGLLLEQHGPPGARHDVDGWQCSADTVVPETLVPGARVKRSVLVGRFTKFAVRYYRRALGLLPEDTMLRCREATAALALDWRYRDDQLMRALGNVSTAHLALADSYRDEALRYMERARLSARAPRPAGTEAARQPGEIAAAYFSLALHEYGEALKRDPTSAAALTQFARVFWEWRQGVADEALTVEPLLEHARDAEWNARRAVAMVEAKLERAPHGLIATDRSAKAQQALTDSVPSHLRPPAATALASLGSVLLGQARPHEALGVLASARTLAPEHPAYDDVRWMLGQALLCAASREWRTDFPLEVRKKDDSWRDRPELQDIDTLRQDAARVLDHVRDHERVREGRPFAGRTDITGASNVCRRDWLGQASQREGRIQYVLKQVPPRRGRAYLCGRLGVRAPRLSGEKEPLYLRVWGDGAERLRLEAGEEGLDRRSDVISLAPTSSRFYYFAQLENERGIPLSLPVALDPNVKPSAPATPNEKPSAAAAPSVIPSAPAASSAPRCPDARPFVALQAERSDGTESAPADRGASPKEAQPGAGGAEVEAEYDSRRR